MNKKGFVQDIAFLGVIILVISMCFIFGYKIFSDLNNNYQESNMSEDSKNILNENTARFSSIWDGIFIVIFIIMSLAIIISISMIPTHPMFFFVGVILFIFILIGIAIISNSYQDVTDGAEITESVNQFSVTDWIMSHLVELLLVVGFIGFIVMYAGSNR
jgi:magnesium-transporting ATPase (P-type)